MDAEIVELKRRLDSGTGELLSDEEIREAWGDFSGWMDASWLYVTDLTFANFVSWLIAYRKTHARDLA